MMRRREVLAAGAALAFLGRASAVWAQGTLAPLGASWAAWKAAYLTPDGRVVDSYAKGASHSESQGYGLYLAAQFADAEAFRSILTWTEANLAVRDDALLAWRWLPDSDPHVQDMNNASDGDVFYAWALVRGAALFDMPAWRDRAEGIVRALERRCLPQAAGGHLLLPGTEGFERAEGAIFNPSYWMPQLMADLARDFSSPALQTAVETGLSRLSAQAGLAPDWMLMGPDGWAVPPEGFSPNTGYEAMRVPLYLCLSGLTSHPMVARFRDAYRAAGNREGTPTVFDSASGAVIERSLHPGYAALAGLADCAVGRGQSLTIPLFSTDQPYYPATLHLFVLIAQIQGYPGCEPF